MKKIILLFLIGYAIFSCTPIDIKKETENDYSEYLSDDSIETDINFMPEEIYSNYSTPESATLKLKLITTDTLACINYGIATSEFKRGTELIIRFDDLSEPEICLTALGPATSYVDIPIGITKITFINGNSIDHYDIDVTSEKVSLATIENSFTSSLYDKTFRIPENSFAVVCGTNTDNTEIYTDFTNLLSSNPDFVEFEFEGEGRIPYPTSSDGHWVDHASKFYTYSSTEEFQNLGTVLNEYSSENITENDGVSISIYGWNNVAFHSWLEN